VVGVVVGGGGVVDAMMIAEEKNDDEVVPPLESQSRTVLKPVRPRCCRRRASGEGEGRGSGSMRNANKMFPIRGRGLSRGSSGLHTVRVKVLRADGRS
jgi:hypothetical protein